MNLTLIIYIILSILFFICSFISLSSNIKFKLCLIPLNIIFLIIVYCSFAFLLGLPKPLLQFPLWDSIDYTEDNLTVLFYTEDNKKIYLLLDYNSSPRLFTVPYTDELSNELKQEEMKQLKKSLGKEKFGFQIKLYDDSFEYRKPSVIHKDPQEKTFGEKIPTEIENF